MAYNCPHCGKELPHHARKHGQASARSGAYRSWQGMIARCTQRTNPAFRHYKKMGITVAPRWRDFANFFADMGDRPAGASLDRIDTLRGYEPGNCRWATKREQANNRSNNRRFVYKGMEYTLADLARATGVSKEILRSRLCRSKLPWTVEGAVETPLLPRKMSRAQLYR